MQAACVMWRILVKWWAEYPAELLEKRVVQPLQQYLTEELVVTKKLTVGVMNTIKVLAKVEEANQLGRQLPPEAFYNQLIRCGGGVLTRSAASIAVAMVMGMTAPGPARGASLAAHCSNACDNKHFLEMPMLSRRQARAFWEASEKLDVEDHYVAWSQTHDTPQHNFGADGPFSFCSYPFLLNPRAKSKLLHVEARFLMTQTVAQARVESAQGPGRGVSMEARVLPDHKQRTANGGVQMNLPVPAGVITKCICKILLKPISYSIWIQCCSVFQECCKIGTVPLPFFASGSAADKAQCQNDWLLWSLPHGLQRLLERHACAAAACCAGWVRCMLFSAMARASGLHAITGNVLACQLAARVATTPAGFFFSFNPGIAFPATNLESRG
ncbi:hypothetical protein MMC29_000581 [Sticta canariensis]|nr:hypothetical protein [Sticta canariensis]